MYRVHYVTVTLAVPLYRRRTAYRKPRPDAVQNCYVPIERKRSVTVLPPVIVKAINPSPSGEKETTYNTLFHSHDLNNSSGKVLLLLE